MELQDDGIREEILDCNDNSPRLRHFHHDGVNRLTQNMSPARTIATNRANNVGDKPPPSTKPLPSAQSTPNNGPSKDRACENTGENGQHGSNTLAQNGDGIVYSSEDTLNNDFFFDDEFTVPFDAHLGESPPAENGTNDLCVMSSDEILFRKRYPRMTSSKSDSCLYTGELENSETEICFENDASQELVASQDLQSSGSIPELNNGPLFSPQTSFTVGANVASSNDPELSNSFSTGSSSTKYEFYDWRAKKDHYTISFDKQALKCSSLESSLYESIDTGGKGGKVETGCNTRSEPASKSENASNKGSRKLTTWAIQRETSSTSQGSWTSNSSESQRSLSEQKKSTEEQKSCEIQRPRTTERRSKSEDGRVLTSWKAIKTPSPAQSENELRSTNGSSMENLNKRHEKNSIYDNLPSGHATMINSQELKENQMKHLHLDMSSPQQPQSVSSDYQTCSEGKGSAQEARNQRRRSSPLLDLYIRARTPQSDWDSSNTTEKLTEQLHRSPERQLDVLAHPVRICGVDVLGSEENIVSPNSLRRMTGTWSMSTASSRSSKHEGTSPLQSPQHSYKGEKTHQPTNKIAGNDKEKFDMPSAAAHVLRHWNNVENLSYALSDSSATSQDLFPCQCDLSACLQCSTLVGFTGLGSETRSNTARTLEPVKVEQSAQYPPSLNTTSMQTSLPYEPMRAPSERYSLIDIGVQTRLRASSEPFSARTERLHNLPISKVSPVIARNRLTRHLLQKKAALPDLSFLNNRLTTSSIIKAATLPSKQSRSSSCPVKLSSKGDQSKSTTHSSDVKKSSSPTGDNKKETRSCHTQTDETRMYPITNSSETPPPVPPRVRRSVSISPSVSREASPANYVRLKSRSNSFSLCSSSSSGIDPGRFSCDSQLNRLCAWSGETHFGSSEYFCAPHIRDWAKHTALNSDRMCTVCHVRVVENPHVVFQHQNKTHDSINTQSSQPDAKVLVKSNQKCPPSQPNSKEQCETIYSESPTSEEDSKESTETLKLPENKKNAPNDLQNGTSPKIGSKQGSRDVSYTNQEPVRLRRPLKSCLRRGSPGGTCKTERAVKHRSWSDPYDATILRYSQEGETRFQLITHGHGKACWMKLNQDVQQTSLPSQASDDFLDKDEPEGSSQFTPRLPETVNPCCHDTVVCKGCLCDATMAVQAVPMRPARKNRTTNDDVSPERIPIMICGCGTTHAVLHSSSSNESNSGRSGDNNGSGSLDSTTSRAKKTVSFAEKVSYHSPNASPHPSPKKTQSCGQLCDRTSWTEIGVSEDVTKSRGSPAVCPTKGESARRYENMQYLDVSPAHKCMSTREAQIKEEDTSKCSPVTVEMIQAIQNSNNCTHAQTDKQSPSSHPPPKPPRVPSTESPPREILVSSSASSVTSSIASSTIVEVEQQLIAKKQELILGVSKAAETIFLYFEKAQDEIHKETLASSKDYPEIGHIVLQSLCPALIAIVEDGLRSYLRSVFGKVKNSSWRLMEESVSQGSPARVLHALVKDINELEFLSKNCLKFNAFIFGLLNHRVLDFWLTYLCNSEALILSHYAPTAFVSLSQTSARPLFLEVTSALQPLAKIPFRLEYNFEYKLVKARQEEEKSDMMLYRHTNTSIDGRIERVLNRSFNGGRPLSVDQALDMLSNSDDACDIPIVHLNGSGSIRDSLVQYSNAMFDTKDKTMGLLKGTGNSIKEKFKQIQRQNKENNESVSDSGERDSASNGSAYLPTVDALFGNTRARGRQPMKVPRSEANQNDSKPQEGNIEPNEASSNLQDSFTNLKRTFQSLRSKLRSHSLDSIVSSITTSQDLQSKDSNKPASRTNSLTDLVSFIEQKVVSFTGGSEQIVSKLQTSSVAENSQLQSKDKLKESSSTGSGSVVAMFNPVYKEESMQSLEPESSECIQQRLHSKSSVSIRKGNQNETPYTVSTEQSCKPKVPPKKNVCESPKMHKKLTTNIAGITTDVPTNIDTSSVCEPINKSQKAATPVAESSFSNTARMFTKRFGYSLINAFDKLLLDPKKKPRKPSSLAKLDNCNENVTKEVKTEVTLPRPQSANEKLDREMSAGHGDSSDASVRKSASAMDFPKRNVRTLCHHIATAPDQMSFEKSCILTVVKEVDKDWLLCYNEKSRGLVHRGFVTEVD